MTNDEWREMIKRGADEFARLLEPQWINPECQAEMLRVGTKEFTRMMGESRSYTPEEIVDRVLSVALWALDLAEAKARGLTDWHGDIDAMIADDLADRAAEETKYMTATPDPSVTNVMSGHREGGLAGQDYEIAPFPEPPGFDRAAYHRDYMRVYMQKRRAAAKLTRTP